MFVSLSTLNSPVALQISCPCLHFSKIVKTKPMMLPISYTWYGIFPEILKKALPTCCHPNASVQFAKLLFTQHIPADVRRTEDYDFTFPLYGDSMEATTYRSNPFIPIIEAPSVALVLMNDNLMKGKTKLIAKTIVKIWPLFLFILLFALCSGIIMWLLVSKTVNSEVY